MEDVQGTRKIRAGATQRQGAKSPGGASRQRAKTVRVTLHLDEVVSRKLGVHCAMVGKNQSVMATYILDLWLSRNGKGREIFEAGAVSGQADLTGEVIGSEEAA